MSLLGDLGESLLSGLVKVPTGWQQLSKSSFMGSFTTSSSEGAYDWVLETATNFILDTVYDNKWVREAFKGIMAYTGYQATKANNGQRNQFTGGASIPDWLQQTDSIFGGILGAVISADAAVGWLVDQIPGASGFQDAWEKMLMEPNIGGVPISSPSVSTDRTVEISEQMVILQEEGQKNYWTDNAVPRLKEWSIEGYITTASIADSLFLIKPSLDFQAGFLDRVATSRRPVLFKTNRGEFVFVQITNLKTVQEASYNNAIKVSVMLKEYNPYTVRDSTALIESGIMPDLIDDWEALPHVPKSEASKRVQELANMDPMGGLKKKAEGDWSLYVNSSQYGPGVDIGANLSF